MKTTTTKRAKEWVNIRIERPIYEVLKSIARKRGLSLGGVISLIKK